MVREMRRAETFLNIIEDPGKLDEAKVKETRKLESRMMRKYPVRFGGGLGEKAVKKRTSLAAYPASTRQSATTRRAGGLRIPP